VGQRQGHVMNGLGRRRKRERDQETTIVIPARMHLPLGYKMFGDLASKERGRNIENNQM
jgi:hypothetical protein